jgi:hypothetical protein
MAGATSTSLRTFTPLLTHFTFPTHSLQSPRSLLSYSSTQSLRPPRIIPQLDPFTHLNSIRSPPPSLCPPSYTHSLPRSCTTSLHSHPLISFAIVHSLPSFSSTRSSARSLHPALDWLPTPRVLYLTFLPFSLSTYFYYLCLWASVFTTFICVFVSFGCVFLVFIGHIFGILYRSSLVLT